MVFINNYTKKCKSTIGGIKKLYLFPFVKYNRYQIQTTGMSLTQFPTTVISEFDVIGNFNQTSDFEGGDILVNQSISIQLNEVYNILDIKNLLKVDYRIIVETNNDNLLIFGLRNGLKATSNNISGQSKGEFNGFKLDFTGKEEDFAMLISSLDDLGFVKNVGGFNYLLNFNL